MNRLAFGLLALAPLGAACGDDTQGTGPTTALTTVPRGGQLADGADIFAMPFPSDFYRNGDGTLDLSLYPRPSTLVEEYLDTMAPRLDGWGRTAAIFARFDGAIDPTSLPADPDAARADGASVYLVDVDPASATRGALWPLKLRFEPKMGETIGTDWLSALPYPGFPLDEGKTYALVVTTRVLGVDGDPVEPDVDWLAVRDGTPVDADLLRLQAADQPLLDWLDEAGGDERADVASAAVFTTQHATAIMPLLRQRVQALAAPVIHDVVAVTANADYHEYDGAFPAPNFQSGDVPYTSHGGEILLDSADGLPIVQRTEDLRVSFTVPTTTKPAAGWPVVIYAHGTGGSYHSYTNDGTARRLAQQGLAVISIDQVLHGPRNPGADPDISFFNVQNPLAARDNTIQGAADDFSVVRLIHTIDYTDAGTGDHVTFDPAKIYFFGHSQGGLTGPPFVAYEPEVKGSVMSGAGGALFLALLTKTEPLDITVIVAAAIRDEPLDEFNPTLALLQTWIERADPVDYGPLLVRAPADGMVARPVYQSEGLVDSYAPPPTIEAFATSIGGDLANPVLQDVPGTALRGRAAVDPPVTDNVDGVTSVLCQYEEAPGSDGHFVVFDVPAAQRQSASFLGTLAATGHATLVTPQ